MDRIKKLAIDIKREISFIINTKIKDPRIGFVTITDTRLSADGKYIDIYLSIMGEEPETYKNLEALKKCSGFIKKNLSEKIKLRNVPELKFIFDDSINRGIKISEILKEISKEGKDSSGCE